MRHITFYPGWLRATHLVTIIVITTLMRGGLRIRSAFSWLSWTDNGRPGSAWITFTRARPPTAAHGRPRPARHGPRRRCVRTGATGLVAGAAAALLAACPHLQPHRHAHDNTLTEVVKRLEAVGDGRRAGIEPAGVGCDAVMRALICTSVTPHHGTANV